ncbi:hypothetical protein EZY14_009350 [Kordia sp. TARA_039_SRF]|nr:hypothetical protein EZY14_009350 [Kordia sp. TARA_039_SRF]
MNDFLFDNTGDVKIQNGDFVIGQSLDQEVEMILRMNPGELKEDPIMGAGLIKLINSKGNEKDLRRAAKLHLARDGKSYQKLEKRIKLNT